MLWSLIKVVVFLAIVAGLALGAEYLMDSQGGVQITAAGAEYTLQPLQAVIALLVLCLAIWLLTKVVSLIFAVLSFLAGDETAITRFFDRGRERRGFKALTEAMVALAGGESREAMKKASKAEKLLQRPELTGLLRAQAAEATGDTAKASAAYKELISYDQTRFVGVRGILRQKMSAGENDTALQLAEKALTLRPRNAEVQDTLLKLQANAEDWAGARSTLSAKLKSGNIPRDVYARRTAVLALGQARTGMGLETTAAERDQAIEANRLSPELVPAAAAAARAHLAKSNKRAAGRVIRKAWDAQPHTDLAAAFAEIEPDETPQARIKRFSALARMKPDHPETRRIMSELHLAAEDFPGARKALGPLADDAPDARFCTLMAAIERGQGAPDNVVNGWLTRAITAPRGPQWVCDNCQHVHGDWRPICEQCEGFDTLTWRSPPVPVISSTTAAYLLPLIVGKGDVVAGDDTLPVPAYSAASDDIHEAEPVDETPATTPDDPPENADMAETPEPATEGTEDADRRTSK
ncbi:heme biosynthesis protein HemY [Chachezhania antarctica]|uniref:heme biosynthesis protein HemY n=1 Tax=Chachezhania antarctica TaxID=2340860 RepID=UPI000EAE77DB|nr:heme biosynthesis HemY N-terminal domain-containing protein [Chachezhania antarctica]|tara:strand:- start:3761 stop:5332 length:1572 start_codon:yes stop_codon:yes gene_type:complete